MDSSQCAAESSLGGSHFFHHYGNTSLFFSSLIVSFAVALFYFIFKLGSRIQEWVLQILTVSFEITGPMDGCESELYKFTIYWLEENVPGWAHQEINRIHNRDEAGKVTTTFKKPPSCNSTPSYFRYDGAWIQVRRTRLAELGVICNESPFEAVTFRTFRFNAGALKKILDVIYEKLTAVEPDETRTTFYYACDGSYWAEFGNSKRTRPLESVILNESTLKTLVDDVKEFLEREEWYRERGIPYRRGYLLYGPPGNGKSSFVKAIAGEFKHNICMLSLSSSKNMNDDTLNNLMNTTPENSIILLEDIDAAFPRRDLKEDEEKSKKDMMSPEEASSGKVTMRGLLNALDGVASTEGRLVFLTTNYVTKLDPAMTRPGRVDKKVHIALPTDTQIGKMFSRFYPEGLEAHRDEFVNVIRALPKPVSMAMIQGLFMLHKHSHVEAIADAVKYFDEQFFSLSNED